MDKKSSQFIIRTAVDSLSDVKGKDVVIIDLMEKSAFTDFFIVATASSNRHALALAHKLVLNAKKNGIAILGVEGEETAEWILVDFNSVIVHIMQLEARNDFDLEGLWQTRNPKRTQDTDSGGTDSDTKIRHGEQ